MKKGVLFILLMLGGLFLLSCRGNRLLPPRVVHYPSPEISIDMGPFEQAGCAASAYGQWECPEEIQNLGCDAFYHPGDLLGGLGVPLLECRKFPLEHGESFPETQDYVYSAGCMMPVSVHYVTQMDGEFRLIRNRAELQEIFAPIESLDEALSYALAATGNEAWYDIRPTWGYRYFVSELEDTRVVPVEDGYEVHLYHYTLCGCGPHTTYAVTVHVKTTGEINISETTPVFDNPEEDTLCVD